MYPIIPGEVVAFHKQGGGAGAERGGVRGGDYGLGGGA